MFAMLALFFIALLCLTFTPTRLIGAIGLAVLLYAYAPFLVTCLFIGGLCLLFFDNE